MSDRPVSVIVAGARTPWAAGQARGPPWGQGGDNRRSAPASRSRLSRVDRPIAADGGMGGIIPPGPTPQDCTSGIVIFAGERSEVDVPASTRSAPVHPPGHRQSLCTVSLGLAANRRPRERGREQFD